MNRLKQVALFLILMEVCAVSHAMLVEDIPTELATLKSSIQEVLILEGQVQQLQYAAKNLQGLVGQQWDNPQNALNVLNQVVNQSNSLAYSMGNIDQQFKQPIRLGSLQRSA